MEMRHEVEVDTALAALYERLWKAHADLDRNRSSLARYAGVKGTYVGRKYTITESSEELAALTTGRLDGMMAWDRRGAEDALAHRAKLLETVREIHAAMKPLEDEYEAKRWSRFFLVKNVGGHIHSSMTCSTCFPTTSFGWLPELSGLTEKDAVDAHGPLLCSVCFPTAPVEWTLGKPVEKDPNECDGSGTHDYDRATYRRYYTGNGAATCTHCGVRGVGVTTTGKLRKHKKPKVKA